MANQRPLVLDTANGLIREIISTDKLGGITGGGASGEALTFDQIGSILQAYDADLAAYAANSTNGLWARTGAGTGAARTITLGSSLTGSNLDGVSGNPSINAIQDILTTSTPTFGSLVLSKTTDTANLLTLNDSSWDTLGTRKRIVVTQGVIELASIDCHLNGVGEVGWRFTTYNSGLSVDSVIITPAGGLKVTDAIGSSSDMGLQPNGLANGQAVKVCSLTELTTIAAAAFTDSTIQFPAGCIPLGATTRVTTVIPTATAYDVGKSGATTFWGSAISSGANTTDKGTAHGAAGITPIASAQSVRITPNSTPAANTGRVRTTIFFITLTPPTS